MVSELHLDAPGVDYVAYADENLRGSTPRSTPTAPNTGCSDHDLAHPRPDRRHRRRHHRLLDGLSSGARPQGRRRAARAGQAHLRLDLACGRAGRAAALVGLDHAGAEILGRALQEARGRDRARHRLEDDRLPAARHQRRPLDRIQAAGDHGAQLRHGHAADLAGRGQDDVAAAWRPTTSSAPRWLPTDGQASPSDITQSLAKGARMHGAKIFEGVRVTGFEMDGRPHHRGADQPRATSPATRW